MARNALRADDVSWLLRTVKIPQCVAFGWLGGKRGAGVQGTGSRGTGYGVRGPGVRGTGSRGTGYGVWWKTRGTIFFAKI